MTIKRASFYLCEDSSDKEVRPISIEVTGTADQIKRFISDNSSLLTGHYSCQVTHYDLDYIPEEHPQKIPLEIITLTVNV